MTQYRNPKARPPFRVGLSRMEVCKRLGVPLPTPKVEEPKEEQKEEVSAVVEEPTTEVQEEQVVEEVTTETPAEPVVEEPVAEEPSVEEEVVTDAVVETPVDELEISKKQIEMLKSNNLNTIEELVTFVEAGNDLEDLPKIGQAAKKSILEGLEAWQNAQNQTK